MACTPGLSVNPFASVSPTCNQRRNRSCSCSGASSARWKLLLCACLVVLWSRDGSALQEQGMASTSTSNQRNRRRDTSGRVQGKALGAPSASMGMDARSGKPEVLGFGRGRSREQTTNNGKRAPPGHEEGEEEEEEEEEEDSCSIESIEDSCEDYDTEEAMGRRWKGDDSSGSEQEEGDQYYDDTTTSNGYDSQEESDEPYYYADAHEGDELGQEQRRQQPYDLANDDVEQQQSRQVDVEEQQDEVEDNSVRVCVLTWNLAEESPPSRDVAFLKEAAKDSDLIAVGVQEIENLKPRRNEGGRTREWRRLLIRTLGRDFVRVGHHAMGAVQLTLFARREVYDRVKVIKLTEVACGVGNVLQNKGGIGAFVRVDRTTFLFVAAHLAAHQGKVEERNAGYWRIVTTLDQEIPPAWVVHAARKRIKRAKASAAAAAAEAAATDDTGSISTSALAVPSMQRGPFEDRVDRVFFFGDLNYRVDLSREDLEGGVYMGRREGEGGQGMRRHAVAALGGRNLAGGRYPGTGALDALLDFDQLTLVRSRGQAFKGFSEARVTFEPTYKYNKGSELFDTSRKMRPPAWTDRILYSPAGPLGVSSLEYTSVPGSRHSDHRPVLAKFRVQLD